MKLNNQLIITIPDFIRNFNFGEFWENKRQFIRDMHPSKIYYWDEELEKSYYSIVKWIENSDGDPNKNSEEGVKSLEKLLGYKVDIKSSSLDFTSQIIRVQAGRTVILPEFTHCNGDTVNLNMHKIEIYGRSENPAVIKIGSDEKLLKTGDFVYVTECDGMFIEFLPTHQENNLYELTLISNEGEFFSKLNVRNTCTLSNIYFDDVVSFTVTSSGYVYIASNEVCKMDLTINNFLFNHVCGYSNAEPLYVKFLKGNLLVLYCDGTLRTTESMNNDIRDIIKADFKRSNIVFQKYK